MTNTAKTITAARAEYRQIRERSESRSFARFDAAVKEFLADIATPTPAQFVTAAKLARFFCGRCGGTGRFVTYVENGIPKGPGGACYRCQGKGTQNDADARRNYGADLHPRIYGE